MQKLSDSRLKTWLVRFGVARFLRPLFGGHGLVLALHRVRDPGDDLLFAANRANMIAPDRLSRLIEGALVARVPIVSLDEAVERLRAKARDQFICLTFDDGYVDNYSVLLPMIHRFRIPVTIYVTPGLLDGTAPLWWYGLDIVLANNARPRLPLETPVDLPAGTMAEKQRAFARCLSFMLRADSQARSVMLDTLATHYAISWVNLAAEHMMTWTQVRTLARSPFVEIGAHTLTHPVLATLDAAAARREIVGSRQRLSREIGGPVAHFAYPFGTRHTTGPREAQLASDAGFRTAVTTRPGNLLPRHLDHAHALPRHGLGPHDGPASLSLKRAGLNRNIPRDWLSQIKQQFAWPGV